MADVRAKQDIVVLFAFEILRIYVSRLGLGKAVTFALTSREGPIPVLDNNGAHCQRDCFPCGRVDLNRGVLADVEVAGFKDKR
jgi:hypothetical protein